MRRKALLKFLKRQYRLWCYTTCRYCGSARKRLANKPCCAADERLLALTHVYHGAKALAILEKTADRRP